MTEGGEIGLVIIALVTVPMVDFIGPCIDASRRAVLAPGMRDEEDEPEMPPDAVVTSGVRGPAALFLDALMDGTLAACDRTF